MRDWFSFLPVLEMTAMFPSADARQCRDSTDSAKDVPATSVDPVVADPTAHRLAVAGERRLHSQARLDTLTSRERDVLTYLVAGAANKVVAIELGISMRTVEAHRAHILRKLGVRNVMALACCVCPHRAAARGGTD